MISPRTLYTADKLKLLSFLVPRHVSVLDIGCGDGDLLAQIDAVKRVGMDINEQAIIRAKKKYKDISFFKGNVENFSLNQTFDYVLCTDVVSTLHDIQAACKHVRGVLHKDGRFVVTFHNHLWQPIFSFLEKIGYKQKQEIQNWLSVSDMENMLYLSGFEVLKKGKRILLPVYIPFLTSFINRYVAQLPYVSSLCITQYIVARPVAIPMVDTTVSVIVPARNEKGNIEHIVKRVPTMGSKTELIFIEGHSKDGTWEEIQRVARMYESSHTIHIARQDGKGKGDAVRKGFSMATGDVLMILDADMTVPPEELPKFYEALVSGKTDFVNGSRLVYEMEAQAMRFLNILGNKFFASAFSWLLSMKIKDTLCGTKVLFKKDYEHLAAGRSYFGDFDPFGDFDLLFGAAKLNLKIVDLPIRYKERTYGTTQIQRFRHGWLLLQMCLFAARKIKFIE